MLLGGATNKPFELMKHGCTLTYIVVFMAETDVHVKMKV